MTKSVVVFCPNPLSHYTNSVCELLQQRGIAIEAIIVRKFTLKRFITEFRRDGKRLLKKIWAKIVLRDKAYAKPGHDGVLKFRESNGLTIKHIKEFEKTGTKIIQCHTLNDKSVEDYLRSLDDKLVIFTGGGIIRKNILDVAGDGIINCHMGILPRYKGMDLPEWCILESQPENLGFTLHFMDTGIDTGDILRTVSVPLGDSSDIKSLRLKFEPLMMQGMVDVVTDHLSGNVTPQPQTEKGIPKQYFIVHPRLYELLDDKLEAMQAELRT